MPTPIWKNPRVSAKVRRGIQRRARTARVDRLKDVVRRRDRGCRMPLCGCRRFHLRCHVAHSTHQGMGGNPREDRSDPATMVLVCAARHREHAVSLDRHTLRWEPLTDRGSDGPIRWLVAVQAVAEMPAQAERQQEWYEIARETSIGQWEPFTDAQRAVLKWLGEMTI